METIEKITIRCFVLGMALLLIWFLFCVTGIVKEVHSEFFNITKREIDIINYSGMMFAKVCIFIFFLFPYIACKWAGKPK